MDTVKQAAQVVGNTIAENFGGPASALAPKDSQFSLEDVPSLTGKIAVVTGGSEGLGYGCTRTLLDKGVKKLYILSMSKEVVDGAREAIKNEVSQEAADRTEWIQCDLSDWKQAREAAEKIAKAEDRLDILINNAARGIMTYQLNKSGVDLHMSVNHIGHVVLTSHLLPLLKKTAAAGNYVRIVNFASNAHQSAPSDTKFASIDELNTDLGPNGQYGRSKLATLLYSRWLNKHVTSRNPNLLANAVHPGVVSTRQSVEHIHEAYPLGGYFVSTVLEPFKKDQFQGCVSAMYCATTTKSSGQYVCVPAVVEEGSALSQDEALAEQLMKLTVEIVKEKTYTDSAEKGCPFTLE